MKKIVLVLFVSLGSLATLKAQTASGTISVELQALASISVGTSTITFANNFTSASTYTNGVTYEAPDQLVVTCSKSFTIKAYSTDLTTGTATAAETISAAGINLLASNGSGTLPTGAAPSYTTQNMGTTAPGGVIVTANGGTPQYKFKVLYTLGGSGRESYFLDKTAGTYTATITYTIVP